MDQQQMSLFGNMAKRHQQMVTEATGKAQAKDQDAPCYLQSIALSLAVIAEQMTDPPFIPFDGQEVG